MNIETKLINITNVFFYECRKKCINITIFFMNTVTKFINITNIFFYEHRKKCIKKTNIFFYEYRKKKPNYNK